MGVSIITLALARKAAKQKIDAAVAETLVKANAYTDSKFNEIISFKVEIVEELPPLAEADPHIIYFVERISPSGEADSYYEYMVISDQWELIGSTELDLSNYWTIDQVKAYVQSKEYILPIATQNQLGGVKIDDISIQVSNDGTISIKESYIDNRTQILIDDNFTKISDSEIHHLFN